VICKGLERNGYVDFDTLRGICSLTEKGEDAMKKRMKYGYSGYGIRGIKDYKRKEWIDIHEGTKQ